jgi:hypothetical protein
MTHPNPISPAQLNSAALDPAPLRDDGGLFCHRSKNDDPISRATCCRGAVGRRSQACATGEGRSASTACCRVPVSGPRHEQSSRGLAAPMDVWPFTVRFVHPCNAGAAAQSRVSRCPDGRALGQLPDLLGDLQDCALGDLGAVERGEVRDHLPPRPATRGQRQQSHRCPSGDAAACERSAGRMRCR